MYYIVFGWFWYVLLLFTMFLFVKPKRFDIFSPLCGMLRRSRMSSDFSPACQILRLVNLVTINIYCTWNPVRTVRYYSVPGIRHFFCDFSPIVERE